MSIPVQPLPTNPIVIPNLPLGNIVDKDGNPTDQFLLFMQQLIFTLQKIVGAEGLVSPSQTTSNINTIAANTVPDPANPASTVYTVEFGTILYDSTTREMKVIVDDGAGVPTVKTFTIT